MFSQYVSEWRELTFSLHLNCYNVLFIKEFVQESKTRMNKNKTEEVPGETEDAFEEKRPQDVARRGSLVPESVLVTEKHKITVSRRLSVTFQPIALF